MFFWFFMGRKQARSDMPDLSLKKEIQTESVLWFPGKMLRYFGKKKLMLDTRLFTLLLNEKYGKAQPPRTTHPSTELCSALLRPLHKALYCHSTPNSGGKKTLHMS